MNENLKAFLAQARADKAWLDALATFGDRQAAVDAALVKAAELGLPLCEEDFAAPQGELCEDELAAVAGAGDCACVFGGGGTDTRDGFSECINAGYDEKVCACVVYGEGWAKTYDVLRGQDDYEIRRCQCPTVGQGKGY